MTLDELLQVIQTMPERPPVALTGNQRKVLDAPMGPLWVIAGPGSGKTEVLVLRALRLIYVDQIAPRSILITTFTEKAARELQDRLTDYASWITKNAAPGEIEDIDITHVRVGTLHSLCNDIMLEFRYPPYQNVRLMDELEQLIFINEHSDLARQRPAPGSIAVQLWEKFVGLLGGYKTQPASVRMAWQSNRALAVRSLVGRIVEYMVNVDKLHQAGGIWARLADGYDQYVHQLRQLRRSDFSHVQATLLRFLIDPKGQLFLNGDGTEDNPGIKHILVDEYQDTNPVQETLYLAMAGQQPHNLMVVGDDDQAIYRFRGGTVEGLINFNHACANAWGIPSTSIEPITLYENFRSQQRIVDWCNHYITLFPSMNKIGARAPGKARLEAKSRINAVYSDYPSVAVISGPTVKDVARVFALTVRELLDSGIITDPSDCALLLRSTRESRVWAGPYVDALRAKHIEVFNPRAKTFMDQEEVNAALGTLLAILDPGMGGCPRQFRSTVQRWNAAFQAIAPSSAELFDYVEKARAQIASKGPGTLLNTSVMELFYILLSFRPFCEWQQDVEKSVRLAQLTRILEAYTSMPQPDQPDRTRGWLATSRDGYQVSWRWRQNFYWGLVAILQQEDLDDEEDEYIPFPLGRLPIMTIFQAKGLQFPFIFVATSQDDGPKSTASHEAEDDLLPFRNSSVPIRFSADERAAQDYARLFYVAHSRAQYGLVILATDKQLANDAPHLGPGGAGWLKTQGCLDLTRLPVSGSE